MKNHPYIRSLIIAVAIIITALILGSSWKKSKVGKESINVTGLASKDFTSDLIVWRGHFIRKAQSTQDAYKELKEDAEKIKQYLLSKGVNENEIVFSSVEINKNYRTEYDNNGRSYSTFEGYSLLQNITIESKEVDKIEKISRKITELIDLNIEFYSNSPEYLYTKLAELKIEMIAKATQDARLRAEKIAENAKSDIGKLKNATMGIFQITGQNSSEEYTYGGAFNTTSKRKTASITIKLEFGID